MAKRLFIIREKFYKKFFLFQDNLKNTADSFINFFNLTFILGSLFFFTILIYRLGFRLESFTSYGFYKLFVISFLILYFSKYIRFILKFKKRKIVAWIYEGSLFIVSTFILLSLFFNGVEDKSVNLPLGRLFVVLSINFLLIISEVYKLMKVIDSVKMSPLLLFALSFLVIILFGSGLLMMPSAHTVPISYLDALFTSTSAVCVTGLVVVNTSTTFTLLGKIIILLLIQIGGLGIMAFTGFFSYAFTGSVSFRDRLMLKDMVSADTLGGIFRLITKIILLTFMIEGIGAVIIYFNVTDLVGNRVFFSIFHSISAFCNAGFSTLPAGLASPGIQNNYVVILTVAFLIIFGGIGFPVLIMLYAKVKREIQKIIYYSRRSSLPANLDSRNIGNWLAVFTSIVLIVVGTVLYFIFENTTGTNEKSISFKIVEAFFGSVSARTAGFNVVDLTNWSNLTIFFMIFLMWVGASPGSTGGGIKTTTFAVALHTALCLIRGRNKVIFKYSEIGYETISRVLVVIILSLIVIFTGFMGLIFFDPAKNPVHLLFESVSAFATVGLSITDSATVSYPSKFILICLMFIGRVGPLTLFTGIFISNRNIYSKFPERDLTIN